MMAFTDEPPEGYIDDDGYSTTSSSPASPTITPAVSPTIQKTGDQKKPQELNPLNLEVDPTNSKLLIACQSNKPEPKPRFFPPAKLFISQVR
ncbi:unnamed protein product, partial [Mesorhabditis spiculigera]